MYRPASLAAAVCLAAILIAVPSAQAAVTQSTVTAPADLSYYVYDYNTPNTFAINGTSNGKAGDHVDLVCFYGSQTEVVASNVAVGSNGAFSVPAADLSKANTYAPCRLRAVPAGTTPTNPAPYAGPRVLVGYSKLKTVPSGANTGVPYDFYAFFQQLAGGFDYDSLAGCGIDDGYLSDPALTFGRTTTTFYCNAYLWSSEANPGTRSELQIDGVDAWPTYMAERINAAASGLPHLKYSYSFNKKTGDGVIQDTEPLVKCPNHTYPPTAVTCASFVSAGVSDHRTIVQDHKGHLAWITDVFTSTDGKAHTLDLLWDNDQRFHYNNSDGDSTQLEYQFPGQSGYATHAVLDTVSLPGSGGTIRIRMHGADDGDPITGRGAIVYDRPASAATFNYVTPNASDFTLHQTVKVPANGSAKLHFAYIQDYLQANVDSMAKLATTVFKGCVVPKVVGKSLAAAKSALIHANCSVGKVTQAASSTVPQGYVVSSKPKAGSHLDYHAKVALVVSKG